MYRGTLLAIFTAPSGGEPMLELPRVEATAGYGLVGDRFTTDAKHVRGYKKVRHVSLLEEETVIALKRDHGIDVAAMLLRRNLLTRGVPLAHLIDRRFRVGNVVLRGTELAEPCQYLVDLIHEPVLMPLLHRGGIRAEIVEGGELCVGDEIRPFEE